MRGLAARAPVNTTLLVVVALMFGVEWLTGALSDPVKLLRLGANHGQRVLGGEVWRLVTSIFLHGSLLHWAINSWALYQLGGLFEIWLGARRYLLVFFVTGLGASIASVLFTRGMSVGASGAIFGILGALITFLGRRRDRLTPQAKSLLSQLLFWAGLNIFFGFSVEVIDNAAHLGGLVVGLILGALIGDRPRPEPRPQSAYEP